MDGHAWFTGPWPAEPDPAQFEADCHRQLRGPYTGLGNLLRALVPGVYAQWPELTREHGTEILSAAPELTELIGEAPETHSRAAATPARQPTGGFAQSAPRRSRARPR